MKQKATTPQDILDYIYNHPTEFAFLGDAWELAIGMWPDSELPYACYAVIRITNGAKYATAGSAEFGERSYGSFTVDEALAILMAELEDDVGSKS